MRSISHNDTQTGFTLVETLVIVPTVLLMLTAIVVIMMSLLNTNSASDAKVTMAYDVQNAFDYVETDARLASHILYTIDSNFSDPYGPDNAGTAWNAGPALPGSFSPLILREYATTTPIQNVNKAPVYVNVYGCTSDVINSNPILTTNVIYFVRNGTLYRRTLTDTSQTTCDTQYQSQTCPPDASTPVNAICKGVDTTLATDISSESFVYYNNLIGNISPNSQSALDSAVGIAVTLGITRPINGSPYNYISSTFINTLNQ